MIHKRQTFYKRRTLRHFLGILLAVVMLLSAVPTDGLSLSVNAQEIDTGNRCEGGGGNTLDNVSHMKLAANTDVSDESSTTVATVTVNGSEPKTYSYAENSTYSTPVAALQAAWDYAAKNSTEASPATLELLMNVDMDNSNLTLANDNSNVILKMNNNVTLTSSYKDCIIQIKNGKLTMESGKICGYINYYGVDIVNGEFILKNGEISGTMYQSVHNWNSNAKFTMNDGKITATAQGSYGVCANNGTVKIEGGTITANYMGVYIGNSAKFTMTEGSITGDCGVSMYGEANITGGTITSTSFNK